ncbi:hypothetical protein, partial [Pseudomonas aeruginosa]
TVVGIERRGSWLSNLMPVLANTQLKHADILWAYGDPNNIDNACQALQLGCLQYKEKELSRLNDIFGVAEVIVPP